MSCLALYTWYQVYGKALSSTPTCERKPECGFLVFERSVRSYDVSSPSRPDCSRSSLVRCTAAATAVELVLYIEGKQTEHVRIAVHSMISPFSTPCCVLNPQRIVHTCTRTRVVWSYLQSSQHAPQKQGLECGCRSRRKRRPGLHKTQCFCFFISFATKTS